MKRKKIKLNKLAKNEQKHPKHILRLENMLRISIC